MSASHTFNLHSYGCDWHSLASLHDQMKMHGSTLNALVWDQTNTQLAWNQRYFGHAGEVPEGTPGSDTADEPGKHVDVGGADKEEDLPQGQQDGSAKQS